MTPSDEKPDSRELDRTVRLMRCGKHGVSFFLGGSCPECEKKNDTLRPPPKETD